MKVFGNKNNANMTHMYNIQRYLQEEQNDGFSFFLNREKPKKNNETFFVLKFWAITGRPTVDH
jgi:hypothetical protein